MLHFGSDEKFFAVLADASYLNVGNEAGDKELVPIQTFEGFQRLLRELACRLDEKVIDVRVFNRRPNGLASSDRYRVRVRSSPITPFFLGSGVSHSPKAYRRMEKTFDE